MKGIEKGETTWLLRMISHKETTYLYLLYPKLEWDELLSNIGSRIMKFLC